MGELRILLPIDDAHLNFLLRHQGKLFRDRDALKQIEMMHGPASAIWPPGSSLGYLMHFIGQYGEAIRPGDELGRLCDSFEWRHDDQQGKRARLTLPDQA